MSRFSLECPRPKCLRPKRQSPNVPSPYVLDAESSECRFEFVSCNFEIPVNVTGIPKTLFWDIFQVARRNYPNRINLTIFVGKQT